jgi:iron complex transport system permease protein
MVSTYFTKEKSSFYPFAKMAILTFGFFTLILAFISSLSVGAANINFKTVIEAILNYQENLTEHQIIYEIRIPRVIISGLVGIGFAISGAIMQGVTRNPLASPSTMGINAGASFALAISFAFFPQLSYSKIMILSFKGAFTSAFLVYIVGSSVKGGLTIIRLALAGASVSALLSSLASGIAIYFNISQDITFWYAGGVSGTNWMDVYNLVPWIVIGTIGSIILSPSITVLSLGEEIALGLGQRTNLIKSLCIVIVTILSGASVSIVGPIAFIGLIVPHIARFLVGVDYRWIIPTSGVLGALLMIISDILARMVNPPYETPIGVITTLIGIPFFLYFVRGHRREI